MDIARRDHHEFFVEEILFFKGDVKKVSSLTFRVKWLAYDISYNSWEPWKQLMDNAVLHKYLIKVNLKNLIPRKFLLNYADQVRVKIGDRSKLGDRFVPTMLQPKRVDIPM